MLPGCPLFFGATVATSQVIKPLLPVARFAVFRAIDAAGSDWDLAAPADDIFLQRTYLRTLEANPPEGMRFAYIVFYHGHDPIGVAYCQIKYFKADDNINAEEHAPKDPCFFNALGAWMKRVVSGWIAADIMICGNLLLSGEHGYHFHSQKITPENAADLLEKALQSTVLQMEREGIKMPVVLVKDIGPSDKPVHGNLLKDRSYLEFDIQPNMVLDLHWSQFDEYLGAMSTKYRTRAKRAFKKGAELDIREFDEQEIRDNLPKIYHLYREIAHNAGFNMVDLNPEYLPALKQKMPDHFRLFACYHQGKLVGFYTTLLNGIEMEAHFLGFEKHYNPSHQIYLNILYQIVRIAFQSGCERIVFARTALEIKSSIGATARPLWIYLKHQHPIFNRFTGHILDYLKPVEVWQPRHPFKHDGHLEEVEAG